MPYLTEKTSNNYDIQLEVRCRCCLFFFHCDINPILSSAVSLHCPDKYLVLGSVTFNYGDIILSYCKVQLKPAGQDPCVVTKSNFRHL